MTTEDAKVEEKNEETVTEKTVAEKKTENTATGKSSMGIIAYLTVIGLIVAFVNNQEKKDPYVKFHIIQSLGITLTGFALGVVSIIPILGWLISILGFFFVAFLWIVGIMNAINQKEKVVPVLGKKYAEWFKNI